MICHFAMFRYPDHLPIKSTGQVWPTSCHFNFQEGPTVQSLLFSPFYLPSVVPTVPVPFLSFGILNYASRNIWDNGYGWLVLDSWRETTHTWHFTVSTFTLLPKTTSFQLPFHVGPLLLFINHLVQETAKPKLDSTRENDNSLSLWRALRPGLGQRYGLCWFHVLASIMANHTSRATFSYTYTCPSAQCKDKCPPCNLGLQEMLNQPLGPWPSLIFHGNGNEEWSLDSLEFTHYFTMYCFVAVVLLNGLTLSLFFYMKSSNFYYSLQAVKEKKI